MGQVSRCPICQTTAYKKVDYDRMLIFYECPICGRYELGHEAVSKQLDYNKLASYLLYHKFLNEYRYHTTLPKELCDRYRVEFENGKNTHGHPVHMNAEIIESWYPKTFAERVDQILLYINSRTRHIGQRTELGDQEKYSALFVDRFERDENQYSPTFGKQKERDSINCDDEVTYILEYLAKQALIEWSYLDKNVLVLLTPEGYAALMLCRKTLLMVGMFL